MLQVLQKALDLPGEKTWAAGSGFGGGVGRHQSMCGALLGGVAALGLYYAENTPDTKSVARIVRPKVQELLSNFAGAFGNTECRSLIQLDFSSPGWQAEFKERDVKRTCCDRYTAHVARTVADWSERGEILLSPQ